MDREIAGFGIVQKDLEGLGLVRAHSAGMKRIADACGATADLFMIDTMVCTYMTYEGGPRMIDNDKAGPAGPARLMTEPLPNSFRGTRVRAPPNLEQGIDAEPIPSPLENVRTIGDFAIAEDEIFDVPEYTTGMRSVAEYDEERDRFVVITMLQMLENCDRFNEDGSLHDDHELLRLENKSRDGVDMFINNGKVCKFFKDMEPDHLPEEALRALAKSVVASKADAAGLFTAGGGAAHRPPASKEEKDQEEDRKARAEDRRAGIRAMAEDSSDDEEAAAFAFAAAAREGSFGLPQAVSQLQATAGLDDEAMAGLADQLAGLSGGDRSLAAQAISAHSGSKESALGFVRNATAGAGFLQGAMAGARALGAAPPAMKRSAAVGTLPSDLSAYYAEVVAGLGDEAERTALRLFLGAPINKNVLVKMARANVRIPFSFMLARPFKRYLMISGILLAGGSALGACSFGHAHATTDIDTAIRALYADVIMYLRAFVRDPVRRRPAPPPADARSAA